jgi:predicted signal transduction protein with EAL and GGDEF domain
MAVLFLDLDRFKDINDSLGHATGDRILRAAASACRTVVGDGHTVARLGGDEFTVVLEDLSSGDEAERCRTTRDHRRLRRAAGARRPPRDRDLALDRHQPVPRPRARCPPNCSSTPTPRCTRPRPPDAAPSGALRRCMDDRDIRRRATLIAALRKVVERGELRLVYQPQLALADGRIGGVEALLRWTSPEHGDVPPASSSRWPRKAG